MTSAGTVAPAKVLVIGAGVAGLQAIATKRLGAVVSSFDVRSSTKEQVKALEQNSLKSKEDSGETAAGYAKKCQNRIKKQNSLLEESIMDIVITTALIPGKPARLISKKMVESMKVGSIIVT